METKEHLAKHPFYIPAGTYEKGIFCEMPEYTTFHWDGDTISSYRATDRIWRDEVFQGIQISGGGMIPSSDPSWRESVWCLRVYDKPIDWQKETRD